MANLRSIDMLVVDDLFDMHGGYVLNFSDRTFATFFARTQHRHRRAPVFRAGQLQGEASAVLLADGRQGDRREDAYGAVGVS